MITAKQYVSLMHRLNDCLCHASQQVRLRRLASDQQLHGHERTIFARIEGAYLVDQMPFDKSINDDLAALLPIYNELISICEANDGNGDFRADFKLTLMEKASFDGMHKFVLSCTRLEEAAITSAEWDAYEVLRHRDAEGADMVEWCQSLLDGIAVWVAEDLTSNDQVWLANQSQATFANGGGK